MTRQRGVFITVATANAFSRNKRQASGLARLAHRLRERFGRWPDVIGVQEAREILGHSVIRVRRGERTRYYRVIADRQHGLAVLLERGPAIRLGDVQIIDGADGIGASGANSHDRGTLAVDFTKRGVPVTMIVTHLPVVDEGKLARSNGRPDDWPLPGKRSAEHAQAAVELGRELASAGRHVFHASDANSLVTSPWVGSLANTLRRAGWRVVGHRVDLVAVPRHARVLGRVLAPKGVVGSDRHDSVGVTTWVRG